MLATSVLVNDGTLLAVYPDKQIEINLIKDAMEILDYIAVKNLFYIHKK